MILPDNSNKDLMSSNARPKMDYYNQNPYMNQMGRKADYRLFY